MPIETGQRRHYPLEITKIESEGKTVYDRGTRGKSYFYLAYISEGTRFITWDGLDFCVKNGGFFSVKEQ